MLNKFLKNKIINYVFSRYAIYALQFINTLMLAKLLSPFNFAVWGFTQLIILYFSYVDFGIANSFNAAASIHRSSIKYVTLNFNAALTLTLILCFFVFSLFALNSLFDFGIGEKYNFNSYIIYVLIIILLGYFNKLLMILFRVYNKLKEITFFQLSIPTMITITYFFFRENLIQYLLLAVIVANILSLLLFLYKSPLKIKLHFSQRLLLQIQKSGIFFFIYNASFYFILLSTRGIISYFYSVEEFGLFNFAFSMASIIDLTLSSFVFLVFPKMINRLAASDNKKAIKTIDFLQKKYTILVSIMSYLAIALYPIFVNFFPIYHKSILAFNLILLTNLVYSNCFGSPVLLMARKKEKNLSTTAFFILLANVVFSISLVFFFKVQYAEVIIGTALAYFAYVLFVNRLSLLELKNYSGFRSLIKYSFPIRQMLPLLTGFIITIFQMPAASYVMLLIFFLLLNYRAIIESTYSIKEILLNPNISDI